MSVAVNKKRESWPPKVSEKEKLGKLIKASCLLFVAFINRLLGQNPFYISLNFFIRSSIGGCVEKSPENDRGLAK